MSSLPIFRAHALAVTLVAFAAVPLVSQQNAETPEQVAARYMQAMRSRQWDSMAVLMHPVALHQLREVLGPLFESPTMDSVRQELLGVPTLAQARALSDTAVFAALISRIMVSQAQLQDFMHDATIQFLGHVPEGQDTVHVVYRMSYDKGPAAISKMAVFSMLRMGNTWRGLLAMDLRMLGAMLRRSAGT